MASANSPSTTISPEILGGAAPIRPELTLTELSQRFGDMPFSRIRGNPAPGTATIEDVVRINEKKLSPLCELVDGVLVEKTMGALESFVTAELLGILLTFVRANQLGNCLGPDGMLRIRSTKVRLPDISFISKMRFDAIPDLYEAAWPVAPDLAVEVVSPSNSKSEMDEKLAEYFEAGTREVWYVYPKEQQIDIYSSPTQFRSLTVPAKLTDSQPLPGFELNLSDIFPRRR